MQLDGLSFASGFYFSPQDRVGRPLCDNPSRRLLLCLAALVPIASLWPGKCPKLCEVIGSYIYTDITHKHGLIARVRPHGAAKRQTKSEMQSDIVLYQKAQVDFDTLQSGDPKR